MALPPRARQKQIIAAAANRYGIKPAILWGLYGQESRYGALANQTSTAGAQGPFQFMPKTAAGLGIDPHNFKQAAFGAAKYLATYKDRGTAGMLAAYNAGPAGNPNNPETRAYIPGVLSKAKTWTGGGGGTGGVSAPGSSGGGGPLATVTGGATPASSIGLGSEGIVSLLQGLQSQKQAPASSGLQAPSFSAQAAMPAAYQAPVSGGGPEPKPDMSAMISALQGTGQTIEHPGVEGVTGTIPGSPSTAGGGAASTSGKGTVSFEGKPVAAWIKPALQYARQHGWEGKVNSGFRTLQEQTRIYNSGVRPAAKPGHSHHEGAQYPRGAVDVSDPEALSRILRNSPWRKKLQWAGSRDPVHFSHQYGGGY